MDRLFARLVAVGRGEALDFAQKLRIFVAVAEAGSFARAATALGMSRPGVTNAVAGLETELGVRLLQRTTRRTRLTGEGEAFIDRAVTLLADVAEAKAMFAPPDGALRGRLRVDIPTALARPLIIPRLGEFTARHPEVELVLGVGDLDMDLVSEGVDCVVRLGEFPASSLVGRSIGRLRMVTCAAPDYLERQGAPASLDDLATHRAVNFHSGRTRRAIPFEFETDDGRRSFTMRSTVTVNSGDAYVECGLLGLGIIQPPWVGVSGFLAAGRLVEVLPNLAPPLKPVSVLYPHRRHVPPQVRAFIDWVEALVRSIGA